MSGRPVSWYKARGLPIPADAIHPPAPIPVMPPPEAPKVDLSSGDDFTVIFKATGLEQLADRLREMPRWARMAAGTEASNLAWEIIEDARANYVPEESGALARSGMADEYSPTFDQEVTQIAMWFGAPGMSMGGASAVAVADFSGKNTGKGAKQKAGEGIEERDPSEYAAAQHENLYEHYTKEGTGPKYLEIPFLKRVHEFAPRIAVAVNKAWSLGNSLGADMSIDDMPFGAQFVTNDLGSTLGY